MCEACLNVETKVSLRSGFTCRIAASSINWFSPLDPKCNSGSFSGLYSADVHLGRIVKRNQTIILMLIED